MSEVLAGFLEGKKDAPRSDRATVLEGVLGKIVAAGRAAHPEIVLSDRSFGAHLARCGAPLEDETVLDDSTHAPDLYLACAAVAGEEAAVRKLVRTHEGSITAALRRIDPSTAFVSDALQRLWDSVLIGTVSSPPRLSSFAGRGPLGGWLSIAAQRVALMMKRHEDAEGRARAGSALGDLPLEDPELVLLKQRYREPFERATRQALETLDDRERLIFRLHLVDGVTVERIAKTYGVSHSTISRWFANARQKVVIEVRRVLREALAISEQDFESLERLVVSQLDLSLSLLPAPSLSSC
jgi:RNA polymerase sigma-70 factor (ECF subfamily)